MTCLGIKVRNNSAVGLFLTVILKKSQLRRGHIEDFAKHRNYSISILSISNMILLVWLVAVQWLLFGMNWQTVIGPLVEVPVLIGLVNVTLRFKTSISAK